MVVHGQETGWQSGVRVCTRPALPTHLVQELYVGTVWSSMPRKLGSNRACGRADQAFSARIECRHCRNHSPIRL